MSTTSAKDVLVDDMTLSDKEDEDDEDKMDDYQYFTMMVVQCLATHLLADHMAWPFRELMSTRHQLEQVTDKYTPSFVDGVRDIMKNKEAPTAMDFMSLATEASPEVLPRGRKDETMICTACPSTRTRESAKKTNPDKASIRERVASADML